METNPDQFAKNGESSEKENTKSLLPPDACSNGSPNDVSTCKMEPVEGENLAITHGLSKTTCQTPQTDKSSAEDYSSTDYPPTLTRKKLPVTNSSPENTLSESKPTIKMRYTRNILILGTIGAGKATLANNIADEVVFSSETDIRSSTREPDIRGGVSQYTDENLNYGFVLVDIFGPFNPDTHDTSGERLKQYFNEYIPEGVSLIILVIRKGASSPEEIENLKFIVSKRFHKNAKNHTALVFTACEGLGESKTKDFLQKFGDDNSSAKDLIDYVSVEGGGKGVYFVSFPPSHDVDESYSEAYKQKSDKSKAIMKNLVLECRQHIHFNEVFKDLEKKKLLPTGERGRLPCNLS